MARVFAISNGVDEVAQVIAEIQGQTDCSPVGSRVIVVDFGGGDDLGGGRGLAGKVAKMKKFFKVAFGSGLHVGIVVGTFSTDALEFILGVEVSVLGATRCL